MENSIPPVTAPISSLLTHSELRYFVLADFTGYCRPRTDFLTGIILKVPMVGGRDFVFPKKIPGKKVS